MRNPEKLTTVFSLVISGWMAVTSAAAADQPLEYNRDIRPILADKCFACHGPDSAARKGGLRVDDRAAAIEMLAIVPGKPGESEMIARIFSDDADLRMPPPATKKTLAFPFDFYPNDMSAGFGDNNNYEPTPFHYAAAKRLKQDLVMGAIDSHLAATGRGMGGLLGGSATCCVLHPGIASKKVKTEKQVAKVWKGLGWGMIADSMPRSNLYLWADDSPWSNFHIISNFR